MLINTLLRQTRHFTTWLQPVATLLPTAHLLLPITVRDTRRVGDMTATVAAEATAAVEVAAATVVEAVAIAEVVAE